MPPSHHPSLKGTNISAALRFSLTFWRFVDLTLVSDEPLNYRQSPEFRFFFLFLEERIIIPLSKPRVSAGMGDMLTL